MARKREFSKPKGPSINLGPFSDVVTSLVIMFMLTIPFLVESGIYISRSLPARLNLPTPQQPQKSDIKVNIHMKADGTILLNEELVDPAILPDLIPKLLARSIRKQALLSADEEVIYENVISMIDLLKEKGASDVLIMKRVKKQ
jgi:biopolymer transport protein ExbD